jgi:hypothetical protein
VRGNVDDGRSLVPLVRAGAVLFFGGRVRAGVVFFGGVLVFGASLPVPPWPSTIPEPQSKSKIVNAIANPDNVLRSLLIDRHSIE